PPSSAPFPYTTLFRSEAFGPRAGFVVGWGEALATYPVAIAAIAVVAGEYVERLAGLAPGGARWAGVGLGALFTGVNLAGGASGRGRRGGVEGRRAGVG